MKRHKQILVIFTICYLILIFAIALSVAISNKENLRHKGNTAFLTAIEKEKQSSVHNMTFHYDFHHSDSVSTNDKINWGIQAYLIKKDPCRLKLDSIFREEIAHQGLPFYFSISCSHKGNTTNSMNSKTMKGTKFVLEKRFRKDSNKENDIILKAHVHIPLWVLIKNASLYVILSSSIIGLLTYIYIKKRNNRQPKTNIPPIQAERTSINLQWIVIHTNIYWDNTNGTLIKGTQKIVLKGESLKFFRLFIKSEQFLLKYETMYKTYGFNDETSGLKDRIYHTIKVLKNELKHTDIQIKTVRGIGYKLTFPPKNT